MEDNSPQIFLHIKREYDYKNIAGFLTIPFDFKNKDIYEYYKDHKDDLLNCKIFNLYF